LFLCHRNGCAWQCSIDDGARQVAIEHADKFCNNWFSRVADAKFNLLAELLLVRSLFNEQSNTSFSSDDTEFMINDLWTS
jgi:hypothetical protein